MEDILMNKRIKKKSTQAVKGTWKSVESRIAKDFGTRRTPLSGINSGHTSSDTLHKELFIEVKHRKGGFGLTNLFSKTAELAKKENKIPIVAAHEKGKRGAILILRSCDLQFIASKQVKSDAE